MSHAGGTPPMPVTRRAESLLRALDGVANVRVHGSDTEIDAVHVVAREGSAATALAATVRSALLAGLATAVTPGRIHVSVDETANGNGEPAAAATEAEPRHRIRLLQERRARREGEGTGPDEERGGAGSASDPLDHARLVAVDVEPADGRIVCRVTIALGTAVHHAEAAAVDLPGAAAQAAAQAAVHALRLAGVHHIELAGLREVEIAGNDYMLVALSDQHRHRSGSAPVIGSAERSAAEAAVDAARQLA